MTEPSRFFSQRRAGVLLHPSSLPAQRSGSRGEIGPAARRFLDLLDAGGFRVWQMLPVGPTHGDGSPYQSLSVHAGSAELISLDDLAAAGFVDDDELALPRGELLRIAAQRFAARRTRDAALDDNYQRFCRDNTDWLDDYALFVAAREARACRAWFDWDAPLRERDAAALAAERQREAPRIDAVKFEQFMFHEQWRELHAKARSLDIALFGDVPIFVAHDSADVWAQPELFQLDANGAPLTVAGVPPDYFSATGQRWGNPLYDWPRLRADDFNWWRRRIDTQIRYFDLLRIDHFRGFEAYWEIPAACPTAEQGRWVKAPGDELLRALYDDHPDLPLVAENLGTITPEVEALRSEFGLPGMLVLQFAFDGSAGNPYPPHRHARLDVVYTGTHDNDTTLGWYATLDARTRARVDAYLGHSSEPMPRPLIRAALASVAALAIVPLQDLLELGSEHRMNRPGTVEGNWRWQFDWAQLDEAMLPRWREWIALYGRESNH